MLIEARKLDCYALEHDGKPLGIFRVESNWMGMTALRAVGGDDLVVVDLGEAGTGIAAMFEEIFEGGAKPKPIRILRASGRIAEVLNASLSGGRRPSA